jgi:hypothetical protein
MITPMTIIIPILAFIKPVTGPQRKHRVTNNSVCCGLLIGCLGRTPKKTRPANLLADIIFLLLSEQTTTKTLLPTVLLLLPSLQALQFQSIILIPYNFGRLYV